jgi:hypothetical protein
METLGQKIGLRNPNSNNSWSVLFKEPTQMAPEYLNRSIMLSMLPRIHTRLLMKLKERSMKCLIGDYGQERFLVLKTADNQYSPYYLDRDLIKEELVKREHIPNKMEAKAIRQAKAKQRT